MNSKSSTLLPLTADEAQAARDFFDGPNAADRLNSFVGWMVSTGKFSGKVAEEVRGFMASETKREVTRATPTVAARLGW